MLKKKSVLPFGFYIFFIGFIFAPTLGWSEQTYKLRKNYDTLQGSTIRQEANITLSEGRVQYDFGGSYAEGTFHGRCQYQWDVTIINRDRKQIVVVSDYCVFKLLVEGEAMSEREYGVLEGETIIGQRIDGIWKHRLLDGVPSRSQRQEIALMDSPYDQEDFYPDLPVSMGWSWTVPPHVLALYLGQQIMNVEGSGTSVFKEVIDYRGVKSALIVGNFSIEGDLFDKELNPMTMRLSGTGIEYRNLRNQMTIDATFKGSSQYSGELVEEGRLIKYVMSGPISYTYSERFK